MLENLNPKKVFYYFEEIAKIPHGSGNIAAMSDYCMNFTKEHGLKAVKEDCGNVIIYAEGTAGYENSAPVILQGHLDMVCEKCPDCVKDMEKDGLDLCTDGEWVWADGTTLGGDDGIAMAYIFAILDSDDIPHPPIEALITADEETGMDGAENLDGSLLKGRRLINIDSEEEGFITVSCAGGLTAVCEYPVEYTNTTADGMCGLEITLDGLTGGHSGVEINKRRLNAHKLLGLILGEALTAESFYVVDLNGGAKTNVIPKSASACIIVNEKEKEAVTAAMGKYFNEYLLPEYKSTEPDMKLTVRDIDRPDKHLDKKSTEKVIFVLGFSPDGIITTMKNDPDTVITSLNMGVMKLENNKLHLESLIRSNTSTGSQVTAYQLRSFTEQTGGSYEKASEFPGWAYSESSPLRDTMVETHREMYGKEPVIFTIHAGLECGLLSEKIPNADMVSIGPDLENVHTPHERMNVASVERVWNYLLTVLKKLK